MSVPYQLTQTDNILRLADHASIPPDPANVDYQEYLAWDAIEGNDALPADPPPLAYAGTIQIEARIRTTDDQFHEIYRFSPGERRLYQGNLAIFGVDAGTFVTASLEGRFVFKRVTGNAIVLPITIVSDIRDTAAATWAPNCLPDGVDVRFVVKGAAGRSVDWLLTGLLIGYAPAGASLS
jgi:hypothetical protein